MNWKITALLALVLLLAYFTYRKNERLKASGEIKSYKKRKKRQKSWGIGLGVLLILVAVSFTWKGARDAIAEKHVAKACDLVLSMSTFQPGTQYGPGINLLNQKDGNLLAFAEGEAYAASGDNAHYEFFAQILKNYDDNLSGNASDTEIHNPLNILNDEIWPVCRSS
jgi:hypothetical protein